MAQRKSVLLVGIISVLLIAAVGSFLVQREFGGHHNVFSKTYFGRPATLHDLFINSADGATVNLNGKWAIVNINSIAVYPAAVWLEKPDIARASFEVRDGEVILTGYTGCNGFGGTAHVLNGQLQTPEIVQTARLCLEDGLSHQETTLIRILSSPGVWATSQIKSSSVVIVGTENIGFVQFRRIYE